MGLATEAKIGVARLVAQKVAETRLCLIEMGHPQPPASIKVDNTMAVGFANKTINQKDREPSICDFFGYKTGVTRDNLLSIGRLAEIILLIITPSTTLRHIIKNEAIFFALISFCK